ncbi:hypothetical protein TNCV_4287931 [Trichonephila clavipes]|uniref:Uncharacterized protein n=1 Tax=Trichonephila clavipes TaxID=2585209 RepID=A0A8X6SEQ1_TRICX|nr:hypothetical protein TNCV_4287931 [Trichonephila clavipes]
MSTGSSLTQNYSRSQSEIQGDLHKCSMDSATFGKSGIFITSGLADSSEADVPGGSGKKFATRTLNILHLKV